MKLRNGFVSNSSSSSFCVLGVYCGDSELFDYIQENFWKDLAFYSGDEVGNTIGMEAETYLEEDKLPDACEKVAKEMQNILPKDIYDKLMNGKKVRLIYDGYYC